MSNTAFPPTRPTDQANMPRGEDQFTWTPAQKMIAHRNMHLLFPSAVIRASCHSLALAQGTAVDPHYPHDGADWTAASYMQDTNCTGLIALKDGKVIYERYTDELDERTVWASRSMAKSVTATLIGIALRDGAIGSLEDQVTRYVPELKGTLYDGATLRHVMRMTSAVPYVEDTSDPTSDIFPLQACTTGKRKGAFLEFLQRLASRRPPETVPHGEIFNYSTADSVLCGLVLERASGQRPPEMLQDRIWQPYGMERDAYWNLEAIDGSAFTGSGIGATLRDYARFGQFVLDGYRLPDGRQLVNDDWAAQIVAPSDASVAERSPYGLQWWCHAGSVTAGALDPEAPEAPELVFPGAEGMYYALGSAGQTIAINPAENIVIVKLAVWPGHRVDRWRHRDAVLFGEITKAAQQR